MYSRASTLIFCSCLAILSKAQPWQPSYSQRNLHTISRIYNLTVYPNNVPVITNVRGAVPSGLFNENATGRVTPVGTFSGFQDSIEYFFGLAPIPHPPTNIAFSKADVVEFTSGCPEVASSVVYLTASVHDPGQPDDGRFVAILKEVATWHFDPSGAVLYYDAFIPTLQNWTSLALGGVDLLNREYQTAAIEGICAATQQRCVGANTQYTSVAVCVQTLAQKPFGDYDETWGDNVVCRSLHIILTLIRPDVHCPHVGPTGGGKCVDVAYNDAYFNDAALFGQPLGKTFVCPSPPTYWS